MTNKNRHYSDWNTVIKKILKKNKAYLYSVRYLKDYFNKGIRYTFEKILSEYVFHATLMTEEKLYLTDSEISYKIKGLCS